MENKIDADRLRAALALRRVSVSSVARRLEVSERHVHGQLSGERPMVSTTVSMLRELLGDLVWRYVVRESDVLRAEIEPRELRPPIAAAR